MGWKLLNAPSKDLNHHESCKADSFKESTFYERWEAHYFQIPILESDNFRIEYVFFPVVLHQNTSMSLDFFVYL